MSDVIDNRDVPTTILNAMASGRLKQRHAATWILHYGFAWSYQQIATLFATSKRTVSRDLKQACNVLR